MDNDQTETQAPVVPAADAAPKPKKKSIALKSVAIFLAVTISLGLIIGLVFSQEIVDLLYGLSYEPSAEMSQAISNVGFSSKAEFIMRSTRPSFEEADAFNEYCPSANEDVSTLGCYSSFEIRIYIYDIQDDELNGVKESILNHEVLHAIYERLNEGKRNELDAELDKYYKEHQDFFGDYMDSYTEDMYYTELHSIIGQRVHYADLSLPLQNHYSQYYADYDKAVGFYDSYHAKLDKIDKEVSALSDEIDAMREDIDQRTAAYNADLEQLNRDIDYHNTQANMGYWSQSRYDSLTARSNQLDAVRDNLNNDIEQFNTKVESFNNLLDSRSHLYGLLDSKYEKKTESLIPDEVAN